MFLALDGPQEDPLKEDEDLLTKLPIAGAFANLNSQLRVALPVEQALSLSQRELSLVLDREARAALLERTTDTREQARLQCLGREGAGDWLSALPCKALGLHLSKQEFVYAAKYRLGLPVFLLARECPARGCLGEADSHRDHSLSCGIGGERIV